MNLVSNINNSFNKYNTPKKNKRKHTIYYLNLNLNKPAPSNPPPPAGPISVAMDGIRPDSTIVKDE